MTQPPGWKERLGEIKVEKWRSIFMDRFAAYDSSYVWATKDGVQSKCTPEDVADFISQELSHLKERVIGELEGMSKGKHDIIEGVYDDEQHPDRIIDCSSKDAECYNQALTDAQERIKNLEL